MVGKAKNMVRSDCATWRAEMRTVGILVVVVLGCGLVWAQAPNVGAKVPTVVIVVKDPSGSVVAGAHVRVAPVAENAPKKMETDAKGELRLQLAAGRHGLSVEMGGFASYWSYVDVEETDEERIIPVKLQIGQMGGPVEVEPMGSAGTAQAQPREAVLMLSVIPFPEKFRVKADELKGMARKTVTVHNAHANADETYEGVELADLLTKYGAPMGKELRGGALGYYLVATGADGYKAVFSLAEVDPSFHPGDVLVVDTINGKALDARTGPLRLVATEDKRPARGVRNLVSLEVKGE
jgi:hypothetical protein